MHEGDNDKEKSVIRFQEVVRFEKGADTEAVEAGAECWLKFVVFDVLFVGGPDAQKVLDKAVSSEKLEDTTPGSIINMSAFARRRILHEVIEPQKNEVEIVPSAVFRPNGDCVTGEDYFSPTDPLSDSGIPAYSLDSVKWTLNIGHPSLKVLDDERRKDRTDGEISMRRTLFVNQFYRSVVEQQKMEGIVVKDLAAPYILKSRTHYWRKIKPDYSQDSVAADLDVVVIGGYFVKGIRGAGEFSAFLVACRDSEDPKKYFTLCRINARTLKEDKLREIMTHTEFEKALADRPLQTGKWFKEVSHGDTLPDFISMRSFQRGKEDILGWRFTNSTADPIYPDLWIKPEDSVVVTVNAFEIVKSDEHSVGLTFRFPRFTRVRGNDKPAHDIETEIDLYKIYHKYQDDMRKYATSSSVAGFDPLSPSKATVTSNRNDVVACQFLTADQYARNAAKRVRERKSIGAVPTLPAPEKKESNVLAGLKFCVLEGEFLFDPQGLDSDDAKSEGWFDEACGVRRASDVGNFILKHGGGMARTPGRDVFVVGGNKVDARVKYNIQGYESLRDKEEVKRKKRVDTEDSSSSDGAVDIPGILKWTFVFSLVYRGLAIQKPQADEEEHLDSDYEDCEEEEGEDGIPEGEEDGIKHKAPELLSPRFFDYLAQSEKYGEDPYEAIWNMGDLDKNDMKRALMFLQNSEDSRVLQKAKCTPLEELESWQCAAESLSAEDRWILSSQYQTLWPYTVMEHEYPQDKSHKEVILYPDLFRGDFGAASEDGARPDDLKGPHSKRWEEMPEDLAKSCLASVLPLLRCMGARVTGHLHNGVTHILCNLKDDVDTFSWKLGDRPDIFLNAEQGRHLVEHLSTLKDGSSVELVSISWAHKKWLI